MLKKNKDIKKLIHINIRDCKYSIIKKLLNGGGILSDDFKFDNLDDFDTVDGDEYFDDFGQDEHNELDNFEKPDNTIIDQAEDKKEVVKTALIAVAIGLTIILIAFVIMRVIQARANEIADEPKNNTVTIEDDKEPVKNTGEDKSRNDITYGGTKIGDQGDWTTFTTDTDVVFNDEYINSIFTVVSIKNYVKIIDSERLMLKTVATGNLSGLLGTYELELPFDKGNKLVTGNYFDVKVQLGNYNGKVLVGEIKY